MTNGIKFKKTVFDLTGSLAITIPPEIIEFLNLKKGTELLLEPIDKTSFIIKKKEEEL